MARRKLDVERDIETLAKLQEEMKAAIDKGLGRAESALKEIAQDREAREMDRRYA